MTQKLSAPLLDKSLLTNLLAALAAGIGFLLPGLAGELVRSSGLYALSGAFTNWMAIYMLFDKVPGFYGSGVIPLRFEEFKGGIRELVMQQFFSEANVHQFFSRGGEGASAVRSLLDDVVAKVDFDRAFNALVDVIMQSSFASMLSMVGGAKVLDRLRDPFVERMRGFLRDIEDDEEFVTYLGEHSTQMLLGKVESIVDRRLEELTPQLVKEIIQQMIRKHLGWLVVWGGVVGALMGFFIELLL
ncbi:MAG: DUF445 domain-containing protein [Pseudomonadota bacterium]|nr:DUF445 domain-containing protein [Pseudomonadota bacterium]